MSSTTSTHMYNNVYNSIIAFVCLLVLRQAAAISLNLNRKLSTGEQNVYLLDNFGCYLFTF